MTTNTSESVKDRPVSSVNSADKYPPEGWDRSGLPAWSYFSEELLQLEKDELFRSHWQCVCHVADLPNNGDYIACDLVGERALVVRGSDGVVRAFHNLCRHRGSRVVGEDKGTCRSAIICPFHGWAYNLDGTLRGASQPASLPDLDKVKFGLKPLEFEIWNGFVFVRFKPGPQPSVKELLGRFDAELEQYGMAGLAADGRGMWTETVDVNWKCIRDVDNEGYHVPMAHPGLNDLFGSNYYDEPFEAGAARSFSAFRGGEGSLWSVRHYMKMLPEMANLDGEHKRAWLYIGVFPNLVFGIYPDSVIFYQEFPVAVGQSIQRGAAYRRPDEDRRLRAARYLSGRIDRLTSREDELLTKWTWEAAFSSAYDGIMLSDREYGVRSYHDALRERFPVLNGDEPTAGRLAARNAELRQSPVNKGN
ncbi:SRPBCC family protein [Hoeflea sp. TYP-13]|uniref:aromatic ring-hydroxylating oxygenase subunit alpha n=1 Tax=Hoeflea sp. TYP-13 TaxID=3230023 RepID=UPI0034C5CBD6